MIQYELNPTIKRTLLSLCRFPSTQLFMFISKLITNSEALCKFLMDQVICFSLILQIKVKYLRIR